jgi:prepilin-type processing-associated H-X9-DG protein
MAVLGGVIYAVIKPVYDRAWWMANKVTCQTRLKDMALAIRAYSKDSDSYLLPVFSSPDTDKVGWAGALQPYIKRDDRTSTVTIPMVSSWPYECPFDATRRSNLPANPGFTDYWYNANVMRKTANGAIPARLPQLKSSAQTILVGCGGSATRGTGFDATFNQCGDGTSLSNSSQACTVSPPGLATFPNQPIHYEPVFGANLLFADSHVKWITGANATSSTAVQNNGATTNTSGGAPTFALFDQ